MIKGELPHLLGYLDVIQDNIPLLKMLDKLPQELICKHLGGVITLEDQAAELAVNYQNVNNNK